MVTATRTKKDLTVAVLRAHITEGIVTKETLGLLVLRVMIDTLEDM